MMMEWIYFTEKMMILETSEGLRRRDMQVKMKYFTEICEKDGDKL